MVFGIKNSFQLKFSGFQKKKKVQMLIYYSMHYLQPCLEDKLRICLKIYWFKTTHKFRFISAPKNCQLFCILYGECF